MKITKSYLKQVIKEELSRMHEVTPPPPPPAPTQAGGNLHSKLKSLLTRANLIWQRNKGENADPASAGLPTFLQDEFNRTKKMLGTAVKSFTNVNKDNINTIGQNAGAFFSRLNNPQYDVIPAVKILKEELGNQWQEIFGYTQRMAKGDPNFLPPAPQSPKFKAPPPPPPPKPKQ